jgi:membrane protein implicated in regulation of membrane protease activity
MSDQSTAHSSAEVVSGASVALVGLGIVTFALFPLALPILILTAAATIPLLLAVVAVGLVLVVIAAPILLVRRLVRRGRGSRRGERRRGRATTPPVPHVAVRPH